MHQLPDDLLMHNIFPLLTLRELLNLIEAFPRLEPLANLYKPWGRLYKERKMLNNEEKLSFREFFDKIQSTYIWGFIHANTSMSWVADRPEVYHRGPVSFHLPNRKGILRSAHGIDIMKPVRIDFSRLDYLERIGHGLFLFSNGELYSRVPGGVISPLPVLYDCKREGFHRSQWGTHVEQTNGKQWTFIPIDDINGTSRKHFCFPFPNHAVALCLQRHCHWALVKDMGIVAVPHNYDGGDDYQLLFSDFPETMTGMVSLYRRNLGENAEETRIEYNETAVLLGESGRLYFYGPARYKSHYGNNIMHPMEWSERYPELNWNGGYVFFEFDVKLASSLQQSLGTTHPPIQSISSWTCQYGIGIYPDDSTILYMDIINPPTEPPFVHHFDMESIGIHGIGKDGYLYDLPLLSGVWHRIPQVSKVVNVFSLQSQIRGHLIDSTTTFVRTQDGYLYQFGFIQNAVALMQNIYREVPSTYMPSAPRISQQFEGGGMNPRKREFINPFSSVPKKIDLPGYVIDMFHLYKEGMTLLAVVKDAGIDMS